ncbi:hypothetical protein [Pseudoruegeria sp. HB172150]|uniref:hypothetical protein n=1 Tax=Pseudoruegeria sp. HB172150 TaxID=2721164 RepID=UPI0015575D07|nr:hypothetical protein [Pseudoruegeria sp. HB172150]
MLDKCDSDLVQIDFLEAQKAQHEHDLRNHFDILSLHKVDRLKHYGLHFAKYVGRLARGNLEEKPYSVTLTDAYLVCLSAANTLHQRLEHNSSLDQKEFLDFASSAGRFCDACEKVDHLEEFVQLARTSNQEVMEYLISASSCAGIDVNELAKNRRLELRDRHFYIR